MAPCSWVGLTAGEVAPKLDDMEVNLSLEQEIQLSRLAAQGGRGVDELAREAVERYLVEETRFRAAVQAGLDAAERGDFVPTSEVWARVERVLKA